MKKNIATCFFSLLFTLNVSCTFAAEINLPSTGQTICYGAAGTVVDCAGTGQDGAFRAGQPSPSPRFTAVNGAVTDNLTGLIWLQNANCTATLGGVAKTTTLNWYNALIWSNNLASGYCGLSDGSIVGDWRLPSILELESLRDLAVSSPALPVGHPFTDVQTSYWSSTTWALNVGNAHIIDTTIGFVTIGGKRNEVNHVWPVRGGK